MTVPTESLPTDAGRRETLASPTDGPTRIAATVDSWKRKLLDLTKRNRALNFRVNKVSTVTIVDEQPPEVFRQIYVHEHSMKFKAAPQSEAAENSKGSLAPMGDESADHGQSEDDENVPDA